MNQPHPGEPQPHQPYPNQPYPNQPQPIAKSKVNPVLAVAAGVVGLLAAALAFAGNLNDRRLGVSDPARATGAALGALLFSALIAGLFYLLIKPKRANVFLVAFLIAALLAMLSQVANAASQLS